VIHVLSSIQEAENWLKAPRRILHETKQSVGWIRREEPS
jgi:hypothetical protein